jgi:hypothetical protein
VQCVFTGRCESLSLELVLEILTATQVRRSSRQGGGGLLFPPALPAAKELLSELIALLIVLIAISAPVLLILWRLHHDFERIRLP